MQVSGIQGLFNDVTSQSPKPNQNAGSFNDYLSGAGNDAVQQFQDYMKETPAQRMFASFLNSEHISQSQYNAMSPQQKEALMQQFEQELKQHMSGGNQGSSLTLTNS
jgi:hypothetical protein